MAGTEHPFFIGDGDDEVRRALVTEVSLPSNADDVYEAARQLLIFRNNHSLIVMMGYEPEPGSTQIDVSQMVVVANDMTGVGIAIEPALAAAQAHAFDPEFVVLGYGTVSSYHDDAVNAFKAGRRIHLVGGDAFHPQDAIGRRYVDRRLLQTPSFGIYAPDAAGRPVKVRKASPRMTI